MLLLCLSCSETSVEPYFPQNKILTLWPEIHRFPQSPSTCLSSGFSSPVSSPHPRQMAPPSDSHPCPVVSPSPEGFFFSLILQVLFEVHLPCQPCLITQRVVFLGSLVPLAGHITEFTFFFFTIFF